MNSETNNILSVTKPTQKLCDSNNIEQLLDERNGIGIGLKLLNESKINHKSF